MAKKATGKKTAAKKGGRKSAAKTAGRGRTRKPTPRGDGGTGPSEPETARRELDNSAADETAEPEDVENDATDGRDDVDVDDDGGPNVPLDD